MRVARRFARPRWRGSNGSTPALCDAISHLAGQPRGSSIQLTKGTLHIADLGTCIVSQPGGRICFFHAGSNAGVLRELTVAIADFLRLYGLSPRHRDILELTLLGCSAYNIAHRLYFSEGTVRNHRKQIYDKLDVTSEREILSMFLKYIAGATDAAVRLSEELAKRGSVAANNPLGRVEQRAVRAADERGMVQVQLYQIGRRTDHDAEWYP